MEPLSGKRLLSRKEFFRYVGLGKVRGMEFAEKVGAVRRYGRRVLIDRVIVDRALDAEAPHSGGAINWKEGASVYGKD